MAIELDATVPRPMPDATATAAGTPRAIAAGIAPIRPGTRLAHFRLERPLGHGGMGEVWLATDLALDRPVAIKLLPPAVAGDPSRRERMVREARAQARLNHPNVCHIYFIGEEDHQLFFAMEYVAGETLAQRLERGALPPDQALELARQAALGLREAHKAGFTHRDIKPSNLMIDGNGVVKVMDFGLVSASPEPVDGELPVHATSVVGTPLYMAPEQGRGEAVDLRADIYALGATLHHMIAGAPPFAGESAAELLSRHETAARAPLTTVTRSKRTVTLADGVIGRMMAKRPADRFASHDELIDALDHASTVRTRSAGFWVRGTATLLDLMLLALLALPLSLLLPEEAVNPILVAVATVLGTVLIARYGTTPGHAVLDLEIAPHRGGGHPSLFAALTRLVVAYGPPVFSAGVNSIAVELGLSWLELATKILVVGSALAAPITLAVVSWSTVDKRPYWDRAAGTRVRYRQRRVDVSA